jgi:hypothetical protein
MEATKYMEFISYSLAPCDRKLELGVSFIFNRHTKGDNSAIVTD